MTSERLYHDERGRNEKHSTVTEHRQTVRQQQQQQRQTWHMSHQHSLRLTHVQHTLAHWLATNSNPDITGYFESSVMS